MLPTETRRDADDRRRGHDLCRCLAAPGRAAIAVMRVSGAGDAARCSARLCGARPPPRRASLRTLRDEGGDVLDRALVLWCPAPGSYTGEECGRASPARRAGGRGRGVRSAGRRSARGRPSRASSRAGPSSTAGWICSRPRPSPTWSRPRARRSGARRCGSSTARSARSIAAGPSGSRACCAQQEALIDFPDEALPRRAGGGDAGGDGCGARRDSSGIWMTGGGANGCARGSCSRSPAHPMSASRP